MQTKGLQAHQRDTLKTVEHFAHLYRSQNLSLPLNQIRSPLSSSTQEAFSLFFISIPLLLTTLKISGMHKAYDAISCNINLWVWAAAWCACLEGWGGEKPGCSASSPRGSQA